MNAIHKGRGYIYSIRYHIVWCVKYRREILTADIEGRLRELLAKIADDNGFTIEELNINLDYVRLLIDCSPQHHIPDMIKALKGVSARLLMKEYGDALREKLRDEHIWSPSYFVATTSEDTEDQVATYIRSQRRSS